MSTQCVVILSFKSKSGSSWSRSASLSRIFICWILFRKSENLIFIFIKAKARSCLFLTKEQCKSYAFCQNSFLWSLQFIASVFVFRCNCNNFTFLHKLEATLFYFTPCCPTLTSNCCSASWACYFVICYKENLLGHKLSGMEDFGLICGSWEDIVLPFQISMHISE